MGDREMAVLRCIELAANDILLREKGEDLFDVACMYGNSISLTKEECQRVFEMKVREVMAFKIEKR